MEPTEDKDMSTRAYIGKRTGDLITYVYCHHDGYPSHVGAILHDHYCSERAVDTLLGLGDLSSLEDRPEHTVAYARDRGEKLLVRVIHHPAGDVLKEWLGMSGMVSYSYLYEDGKWRGFRDGVEFNVTANAKEATWTR